MKITTLLFLFLLHNDCSAVKVKAPQTADKETVYLCGSGKGKKYHLSANCRGLNNCSSKAVKTTLKQATKHGKTLCGWEK